MRFYVPELEVILDTVRCEVSAFEGKDLPCFVVNFQLKKYPSEAFHISSIVLDIKRQNQKFNLNYYTKEPLTDFDMNTKQSSTKVAIIKAKDLPFEGFDYHDLLSFSITYSKKEESQERNCIVTFIYSEDGWSELSNNCPTVKNPHYINCNLPVLCEDGFTITLTSVFCDYKKIYYGFALTNYSSEDFDVFLGETNIAYIDSSGCYEDWKASNECITLVYAHSTSYVFFSFDESSFQSMDYPLIEKIHTDPFFKATISFNLFGYWGNKEYESDWIVNELSVYPKEPYMNQSRFCYPNSFSRSESTHSENTEMDYGDFLIYSYAAKCTMGHKAESVNAIVSVVTPSGEVVEKKVPAVYCSHCRNYIILKADYERLQRCGIILCKQISIEKYTQLINKDNMSDQWQEQSVLNYLGYNVNAKENLSPEQRHIILRCAVDKGLYTVAGIRSFLQLQIDNREGKSQYMNAIRKWKSDIEFITNYYGDNNRNVRVKSLKKTIYH